MLFQHTYLKAVELFPSDSLCQLNHTGLCIIYLPIETRCVCSPRYREGVGVPGGEAGRKALTVTSDLRAGLVRPAKSQQHASHASLITGAAQIGPIHLFVINLCEG